MKIQEIILLEDRAEYIATQMKDRLEAAAQKDVGHAIDSIKLVDELKKADPDPQGRNLQFIANMYTRQQFKLEDLPRLRSSIASFIKFRSQLAVKDINQIKSLEQLYDLTDPLEKVGAQAPVSQRQQEKQTKIEGADVLMDTPNFKVIIPRTREASCLYGKGTRWCTSADSNNRFEHYSKQGDLYQINVNLNGTPRKFLLHMESDQFMNEKDIPVKRPDIEALSQMPEYTKFLNFLIKKYYGKYFKDNA